MTVELRGRPVVVTGGGSGIGAAIAHQAATRGASVVLVVDVDEAAATAVAASVSTTGVPSEPHACDVTDAEAMGQLAASVMETHGAPALVCANAGVMNSMAPLLDTPAGDIDWILGVNVGGTVHTLQSFGRLLAAQDEPGWLLVTGSEHSVGVPHTNNAAYTASKHAILGLCDVLRAELPAHVGVSVLLPGLTTSQLWNSTSHRPAALGGPSAGEPLAGQFMEEQGMDPATVAERALDGVVAGQFLIPTHYNARAYADQRAGELSEAFDRLGIIDTTDYDVERRLHDMFTRASETDTTTEP
jgi:NAD(P)-dependent dehydrogenase (short-subunit alcohol dehydrogenase family)